MNETNETNTTQPTVTRRLTIAQLADRFACSSMTVYRWYTFGDLPRPHYLGQNRVWFEHDVEQWEQKQMSSRASIKEAYRNASDEQIAQPSSANTFYTMSGSSPPESNKH